jgi:hypothetical protein
MYRRVVRNVIDKTIALQFCYVQSGDLLIKIKVYYFLYFNQLY